jgi:hypothetical protein
MNLNEPPVRLCCGHRHWGAMCPDGLVMCCICYGRFTPNNLFIDKDGQKWDMCIPCGEQEVTAKQMETQ